MTGTEVVEAEVVEQQPAPASDANLFRTTNPAEVLRRAQDTADALMPVVRTKGLVSNIQGREYLNVEAWQTLATMLGVTARCEWTHKLENGWEARVEALTLDGRSIGAAEAQCLYDEDKWKDSDDYALRSMAQTRATSKALASVLRFVATLAGVEGTPAEEMPSGGSGGGRSKHVGQPRQPGFNSEAQENLLRDQLKKAGAEGEANRICAYLAAEHHGGRGGGISQAIDGLMDAKGRKQTLAELLEATGAWEATQSDLPAPDTTDLPPANEQGA